MSLSHIESRPSVRDEGDYEFLVEFCAGEYGDVKGTLEEIKKQSTYCKIISREETEGNDENETLLCVTFEIIACETSELYPRGFCLIYIAVSIKLVDNVVVINN